MSSDRIIKIGTRASPLALAQTQKLCDQLSQLHSNIEIIKIITTGDRLQNAQIWKLGGKEVFTKEIENALLAEEIDIAVHSMKDVPAELAHNLHIISVLARDDPRDALISEYKTIFDLPHKAILGTSSPRREQFILYHRPDIQIIPMRGNVDTRIKKMHDQKIDAIILATAAIQRLNLDIPYYPIDIGVMLPSACQGTIGMESRIDDDYINSLLRQINHDPSYCATQVERSIMAHLNGGCSIPFASHAIFDESTNEIECHAAIFTDHKIYTSCNFLLSDMEYNTQKIGDFLKHNLH